MASITRATQPDTSAYTVGWVCALEVEIIAALDMRDEEYESPDASHLSSSGGYLFEYGRINRYKVVFACLSAGDSGSNSSARIVSAMRRCFRNLDWFVMSGIAKGIPREEIAEDESDSIQLGDVIIAMGDKYRSGIVPYTEGKWKPDGFELTGWTDKVPLPLTQVTSRIKRDQKRGKFNLPDVLANNVGSKTHALPKLPDELYNADYEHPAGNRDCRACSKDALVERKLRRHPRCHFGLVLSGALLLEDAKTRDDYAKEYPNAQCFEMEGAGLDEVRGPLVKGVSDYADSHYNNAWHEYAATNSAAVVKYILTSAIFPSRDKEEPLQIQRGV